ncbi:MAG TPA: hypothetical protein VFC33_11165 [Acidimicrobiia bacterium]|nr:hypothetical protein [Acidimicrobiia bacterium]
MTTLPEKIVAIHRALDAAALPHAFGGALALAWCTERARGTVDIDVNVFVDVSHARDVLDALPSDVAHTDGDVQALTREGQHRLWWEATPVDLFLDTTDFHEQASGRVRREPFAGVDLPFLSCTDLAIFKAFFNRPRDWGDLAEMQAVGTLDVDRVVGVLVRYLGPDDERVERLRKMA